MVIEIAFGIMLGILFTIAFVCFFMILFGVYKKIKHRGNNMIDINDWFNEDEERR